jgi:hypothetical protein
MRASGAPGAPLPNKNQREKALPPARKTPLHVTQTRHMSTKKHTPLAVASQQTKILDRRLKRIRAACLDPHKEG